MPRSQAKLLGSPHLAMKQAPAANEPRHDYRDDGDDESSGGDGGGSGGGKGSAEGIDAFAAMATATWQ